MVLGVKAVVYVVCSILGFLVGHYFLTGTWAACVSILISYHLFLGWLLLTAEHKKGFSLPIGSTILTHSACLALVVTLGIGRSYIPFFSLIRFCIPALAPFECTWLFSGNTAKKDVTTKKVPVATTVNAVSVDVAMAEATIEDHDAWLHHLAQPNRPLKRAGLSTKEEYGQWLVARVSARRAASTSHNPA
jgi:hypothetical protein